MNHPTSAIAVHGDARRADLLAAAERIHPLILRPQPASHPNRTRFGPLRRFPRSETIRRLAVVLIGARADLVGNPRSPEA